MNFGDGLISLIKTIVIAATVAVISIILMIGMILGLAIG